MVYILHICTALFPSHCLAPQPIANKCLTIKTITIQTSISCPGTPWIVCNKSKSAHESQQMEFHGLLVWIYAMLRHYAYDSGECETTNEHWHGKRPRIYATGPTSRWDHGAPALTFGRDKKGIERPQNVTRLKEGGRGLTHQRERTPSPLGGQAARTSGWSSLSFKPVQSSTSLNGLAGLTGVGGY